MSTTVVNSPQRPGNARKWVAVPVDLHAALKARSLIEDRTMAAVLRRLLSA